MNNRAQSGQGGAGVSRIRVLVVLEATVGGTLQHILDVCNHIDLNRFAVDLAVSFEREPSFRQQVPALEARGIDVHQLHMTREPSPLSDLRALYALRRLVRGGDYDVVHTHSSKAGILGRFAIPAKQHCAVIHTPHVFAFQMNCNRLMRAFYRTVERAAARRTDWLHAVCQAEKQAALAARLLPEARIKVICNGVDVRSWTVASSAAPSQLREPLGIPADAPVIGTVGRYAAQKGWDLLVEAMPAVLCEIPEARLVLVGDDAGDTKLKLRVKHLQISDSVHFYGATDHRRDLYAMFNLFVLPSRWEALPYALLEAAAVGAPVLATNVGGVNEVVIDNLTGSLVPPEDSSALAQKMIERLRDPERTAKMALAAKAKVAGEFRLDKMISGIEKLYSECGIEN
jgi:glycosyltransferase involved in cell wall biosynthesis